MFNWRNWFRRSASEPLTPIDKKTRSVLIRADEDLLQHASKLSAKAIRLAPYDWDVANRYHQHSVELCLILIKQKSPVATKANDIRLQSLLGFLDVKWQVYGRHSDDKTQANIVQEYQALSLEGFKPAQVRLNALLQDKALNKAVRDDAAARPSSYTGFEDLQYNSAHPKTPTATRRSK